MARHYVLCFIHAAGSHKGDVNHAGQLQALQTASVRLVDTLICVLKPNLCPLP